MVLYSLGNNCRTLMASNMAEGDGKQTTQSSFHRSLETLKEFDGKMIYLNLMSFFVFF